MHRLKSSITLRIRSRLSAVRFNLSGEAYESYLLISKEGFDPAKRKAPYFQIETYESP